jgi:hypothetical protein
MTRGPDRSTRTALTIHFPRPTSRREHSDRRNDQPSTWEQQLALIAEARAARRLAHVQELLPQQGYAARPVKPDAEQFG